MTPSKHSFRTERLNSANHEVVAVSGEFDARAVSEFEQFFCDNSPAGHLTICLNGTTIIDSAALGALIRLNTRLGDAGQDLVIHRPRDFQRELFTITGLQDILQATIECACEQA